MLGARCGNGKLQSLLRRRQVGQAVDEPGGKGIPRAHAIHDVANLVVAGDEELLPRVKDSRPAVLLGGSVFPQGDGKALQAGMCAEDLLGKSLDSGRNVPLRAASGAA